MTGAIDLNPNHLEIVERILTEHVPECEVRAFGSRATWTARDYSDLDLAIVGEGPLPWRALSHLREAFEESRLPMRVDVLDWHDISQSFQEVIQRDYVVLQEGQGQDKSTKWAPIVLGESCTKIGSGATPRGGKDSYLESGPYALIRSQNVYNAGFRHGGLAFIDDAQADALRNVEVASNDVLLNITGDSVARVCQVDPAVLPARVNQHVAIIRPDAARLDARFLRYYLASPEMQTMLLSWAGSGGTRNALTKKMIESVEVRAPSDVREQRAIAHVLGTLDDKIELNRRMNETLEAMARALFRSWFVDFEPVRAKMEGRWRPGESLPGLPAHLHPLIPDRLVPSELGDIPEGWEVLRAGEAVTVSGGSTPSTKEPSYWDGEYCFATPKEMSLLEAPILGSTARKLTDAGIARIRSGLLPPGTVLLSSRAPIGYLAITETPVAINQGIVAMVCDGAVGAPYALNWTRVNMDAIEARASGTTFAEISKSSFRDLPFLTPSQPVHAAYEAVAGPLYERVSALARQSRDLVTQRDTLLPRLVSAETRVRSVAQKAE